MVQQNYIAFDIPTGIEPAGVKCYCFSLGIIYEQVKRPKGSNWVAIESNVNLTGQKMATFLFDNQENDVDLSGTALEQTSSSGSNDLMTLAIANMV